MKEMIINLDSWIDENEGNLLPPVCNKLLFDSQLKVFLVGGPNHREDYHINNGEEVFIMLKGDMLLKVIEKGQPKDIVIREGRIPHSPRRSSDTLGMVIERQRTNHEMDCIRFYCDNFTRIMFEKWFHCVKLDCDIGPIIEDFLSSKNESNNLSETVLPSSYEEEVTPGQPIGLVDWLEANCSSINARFKQLFPQAVESRIGFYGPGKHIVLTVDAELFIWFMGSNGKLEIDHRYYCLEYNDCMIIKRLVLSSPDVDVYEGWKRAPIPIYTKFYIFNLTNPDDVITGKSGPILKELGPYVFSENREKINISWNHVDGTVSYHQIKRYHHLPEETVGSLKDKIVHLNVPLASMIHVAKQRNEDFLYNFIEELTTDNEDGLFLTHTVGELLFDGYEDELLNFINENGLSPVKVERFGFFHGRNGTITDGLYSIYTGENGSIDKFGTMSSWNNNQSLPFWNTSYCNKLESTWPGDLRPPYPDSNPTQLKLFTPDICRWMSLKYLTKRTTLGVETIRYMADPNLFDYTLEENKCYCTDGKCPANGIFITSLCTHGSPSSISFPHFLFADPIYSENIQGLSPDPNKHVFLMDIEPTLGIPVDTLARLQVNMLLEKDERLDLTTNLKASTHIPMFWFETSATIGNETVGQIKLLQQQVPHFIIIGTFVQITIAVALLIATLIYILKMSTIKELVPRPSKKQYKNVMTTSFQS